MLPTSFGNPLWFSDDELLELKGTTLYRATELQVIVLGELLVYAFKCLETITNISLKLIRSLTSYKDHELADIEV